MYSTLLVIFSITIVTALMFDENTRVARDASPWVALIVMWAGIIWMSMVEGGQCSMVGLPPIDRKLYEKSHPITFSITTIGHRGDNLDRYLMGRQFLVIFINFTISLCGAPIAGAQVLGLPDWVSTIFLASGIAMVLTNVNIGQLTAQCNASHCMLDYINTYFMTFTLYACLLIEKTGFMHVCYLIRDMFYWAAGKPIATKEPPRSPVTAFFHWGRVAFSMAVVAFSLAVTLKALFVGQTTMWNGVPDVVSIILFFGLMCIVGMLEGMQIAFFHVSKMRASERGTHSMAMKTCEILFKGEGRNLPGFMVGRQMTVTLCFFIIARVTTINTKIGVDENIFGVPDAVQEFFNLGSFSWQLVAGAFPLAFLSNPLVFILLNAALALEYTGVCHAAWFFGIIHKKISGFQLDEVYVGTAEERAAGKKPGSDQEMATSTMGTIGFVSNVAHLDKDFLQVFSGASYTEQRAKIMANISVLQEAIKNSSFPEEAEILRESYKLEIYALKNVNQAQQEVEKERSKSGSPFRGD